LEPGDVTLFRIAGYACRYVEPWWVEERHGLAFRGVAAVLSWTRNG
jgi:hypothetical protein